MTTCSLETPGRWAAGLVLVLVLLSLLGAVPATAGVAVGPDFGITTFDAEGFATKPHWGARFILRTPVEAGIAAFYRVIPKSGAVGDGGEPASGYQWAAGLDLTYGHAWGPAFPYLLLSPGFGQIRADPGPVRAVNLLGYGGGLSLDLGAGVRLRAEGRINTIQARDAVFDGEASRRTRSQEMTLGLELPLRWPDGDADFDGVNDRADLCPGTGSGIQVDAHGCALDGDGDGVPDGLDLCPTTPRGATADRAGCPLDSDGDGVFDGLDRCAGTAPGAAVDPGGCTGDSDGDGVPDGLDLCAGTAAGAPVDDAGCPPAERAGEPSAALAVALRTPVKIDATETKVADILRLVGQQTGINVIVDSSVEGLITLHVAGMPGRDALELIVAAAGMTYYWERDAVVVTTPQKLKASGAVQSIAIPVRHVRAADLVPSLGALVDDPKNLQVGPRGQHLIVTSTPDRIAQARDLIESMDRPLPQVAIEVRVVEIAVDRLREVGINLAATRLGSTLLAGTFSPPSFAVDPAGKLQLQKSTSDYTLDATLRTLERRGEARILASPRLLTLGGQAARILIGDRVPYFTTQIATDGTRQIVVNFVEVGIRLDLQPSVQADRAITTRIRTEVSSIVAFRGPLQEIPWVKTREAETTVRVESNQWVSLGGLLSREERTNTVSVPVLGDIPVLGHLFKARSKEMSETEVVIMVSPTLVRP